MIMEFLDTIKGNCYHICTNGQECQALLRDEDDYKVACNYLAISAWKCKVVILAYIIMSNHVHILVVCDNREIAEKFIRLFKQKLSIYLAHKYGILKPLHGVDNSISLIDSIQYFKNCVAYILRNAISAKLCSKLEDYPWSSYSAYFSKNKSEHLKVSSLSRREKRKILKSRDDLRTCNMLISHDGRIVNRSFVNYAIVEAAFRSAKSFLFHLGVCNDSQMEYEFAIKPKLLANDTDILLATEKLTAARFSGKRLNEISTANKCSMVKNLFYNNKTTIPQLSRILGLPRDLICQILST